MASGNALSGSGKSARPAAPTHPGGQSQPSGQLRRLSDLGYLKLLPLDVRDSILRMLSPDHSCIRSPYGAHDCALSYGPQIKGLKALSLTCRELNDDVPPYLKPPIASVAFRQEASRRDYEMSMRRLNASLGQAGGPDEESYARREIEIIEHCRRMYDIDHLPVAISFAPEAQRTSAGGSLPDNPFKPSQGAQRLRHRRSLHGKPLIPMSAQVNLALGRQDLVELSDARMGKYWRNGKTHAFYIVAAGDENALTSFLSHYPEGLVALELPQLFAEDLDLVALGAALGRCSSLQHLAIHGCSPDLAQAIPPLRSLLSLKLMQPAFSGASWESEFKFVPRSLQSLWVEAPEHEGLLPLMNFLPEFSSLRELRLTRSNMARNDEWNALAAILSAPAALTELKSLELQGVPDGAGEALKQWTLRLNRLALPEARLGAQDQVGLLKALSASNSLCQLELKLDGNGRFAAQAITALSKWLALPNCSLRLLDLQGRLDKSSVNELASGMEANRSVEMLALDIGGERGDSDTSEGSDADGNDAGPQTMEMAGEASESADRNAIEYSIAKQVAKSEKLQIFRLRAGRLSADQVATTAVKVLQSKSLLELDLRGCNWDASASALLRSFLETRNDTLIRVCFSDHRYETELEPLLLRNRGESVGTGNH